MIAVGALRWFVVGIESASWQQAPDFEDDEVEAGDDRARANQTARRLNQGRTPTWTRRDAPDRLACSCNWCLAVVAISRRGNAWAFHAKFKKMLRDHATACWPPQSQRERT